MVLVENSVLEEEQPVSEQRGCTSIGKEYQLLDEGSEKRRRNERYRKVQSLR
jgi:hypothetical protein